MILQSMINGGVHPVTHKHRTAGRETIMSCSLPERLYLPLFQQAGAMSNPIVQVGQQVAKGECIAVGALGLAAHLHAPTSGTITSIETIQAPHPSGLESPAIVLQPDGDDRWAPLTVRLNPFEESPECLEQLVEQAGIVGLGGAIFPSAIKLRQGRRFEIKTLIINGGECEPYLTTDDYLMRQRAEEIIEGVRLIKHIIEAYEVFIGIEDNKPEAIAALTKAAEPYGTIQVRSVPTIYPMGSAKQLIKALTGKEVPSGGRSNDLGILVHNVATAYAIQQALRYGRPLISRIVTVAGGCVRSPANVEVLFGTPMQHLFAQCGGLTGQPKRMLLGGPMMGQVVPNDSVPVMKGTSGVLALTAKEVNEQLPSPCIRCSRCVSACPMGLLPLEMSKSINAEDLDSAMNFGLKDCIVCGACTYVCPSHIPLVNFFEYGKGLLRERRASQEKLAVTKTLTEERSLRLAAEAAAKKAAKAAKRKRSRPPVSAGQSESES